MFQLFLDFCSTRIFDQGGVIINPKDGEILETGKFLNKEITSKFSSEEVETLMRLQENSQNNDYNCNQKNEDGVWRGPKYSVNFIRWNWYMVHPFVTTWRFSALSKNMERVTIAATRKTNERLKTLTRLIKDERVEKAFEICGASLCEILKIDREIPAIDPVPSRPSRKRRLDSYQTSDECEHMEREPEEDEPPKKKKCKKVPSQGPALVTFDLEKSPAPTQEDDTALPYQIYSLPEESVVIPDSQFDKVLQAVNFLKKVFFHSNDPTCKVSLFRSWNLKLKPFQDDPEGMPLVYVYNRKPCAETDSGFTLLPSGKIWSILKSREVKKKMNILEGPTPKGKDPSAFKKGWTLECRGFGEEIFKLCLFSSHKFLFEVEISGLLEYMCKFDGRAYQIIKLAYFWMGVNELSLGVVGDESNGLLSLQWLVIFWMCHMKRVPSPREIQGRGNHKVMRDGGTGLDLGWEEDNEFLEEWKEKAKQEFKWSDDMTLRLLEGFRDFLEFCGWLESSGGNWILNTRNGELIKMKEFLKSEARTYPGDWAKNMSEEEVGILKAQVVNFRDQKIYMTHPLNLQWRFGLRNDIRYVLKLLKAGGTKLKKYLNMRTSNGEKVVTKRFKSLRNVLTLSDVDFNKTVKKK
ncbi:MAG: hypothetical protein V4547_18405 [Bacteroidota bacterium]